MRRPFLLSAPAEHQLKTYSSRWSVSGAGPIPNATSRLVWPNNAGRPRRAAPFEVLPQEPGAATTKRRSGMSAHKLTALDELRLWWSLEGELRFDLLTYYGVCCAAGYLQGWLIGSAMIGRLPW